MTVTTNTNSGSFTADGLATPRSINFRLINHADLIVTANGVVQTLNVHYSLSGTFPSITMTPITPYWASGVVVRYRRKTPAKQEYDPQPGVDLSANSIELELDRQTMALQDVDADLLDTKSRALMVPMGEVAPAVVGLSDGEGMYLGVEGGQIVPLSSPDAVLLAQANAALTAANAALATVTGPLASVSRYSPRPRRWTSPSGMLNPLGVAMDCNGERYSYSSDIHALNDWSQSETGITQLYVHPLTGNDSNPGTSEGSPWKSLDKIVSSAPDKSIIDVMYHSFDYNTALAGSYDFGTRRIKIRPKVSERVLVNSWRFSYDLAFLSWTKDGDAYKTTASINGAAVQNMMDGKYRDQDALPLPFVYVTTSALVKSTPGSWWWDSGTGTLWVHMIDGRVPDPADGWIPITSFSGMNITTDGSLALEGMEFAFHGGSAGSAALRVRPTTAFVPAVVKLALQDVLAYGSDGNAIALLDMQVATLKRVRGGFCRYDVFNHSSFRSTGTAAEDTTYYEDNCYGVLPGYDKTRSMPAASNSNNISTGHRGANIFRLGTRGRDCPNSFIADVHGCYSMNAGIVPTESTLTGGLFLNNFWNQRLTGQGPASAKMVLIGCGGEALSSGRNVFSNADDTDTAATLGEIHVADWLGPPSASRKLGTIVKNYETGAAL